jgi:hypothetical protein
VTEITQYSARLKDKSIARGKKGQLEGPYVARRTNMLNFAHPQNRFVLQTLIGASAPSILLARNFE